VTRRNASVLSCREILERIKTSLILGIISLNTALRISRNVMGESYRYFTK
jgi:hypothetical protein